MISGDEIVEQLKQIPNGNAAAICVSFLADMIYPDEDEESVNKSLGFIEEVFEIITKHRREAKDAEIHDRFR